jgi:flavin reductase (DIM6/NTAB) family NADH-FMN oxidoreductase RutF
MSSIEPEAPVIKAFERFVAALDYPLYIITTAVDGAPTGCLIGFATQSSIHPPRFLACLSKKNHTFQLARRASTVAVHVLEKRNTAIAELFGGETGDQVDKFTRVKWHYEEGVPILDDCERWFIGTVLDHIDFGDHVGHVLLPTCVGVAGICEQMTYQQARYIDPGHRP